MTDTLGDRLEQMTTWLESRLARQTVRPIRSEGDDAVWQIDRPAPDAAPVFLEIPASYLRSDGPGVEELTRALDDEDLEGRVAAAEETDEAAWLLTRRTTGRMKELVLTETEPPARADRSVRQPPDAPGPVPR